MPTILDLIMLPERYKLTNRALNDQSDEKFILYHPVSADDLQALVMATRALQDLEKSDVWIMDGTFCVCPTEFSQVYSIHCPIQVSWGTEVMPLVYTIMPNRIADSYRTIFDILISAIQDLQLDQNRMPNYKGPKRVLIDFETSVIKMFRSNHSPFGDHVELDGCLFHWIKCLVRKLQELGLMGMKNIVIRMIYECCETWKALIFSVQEFWKNWKMKMEIFTAGLDKCLDWHLCTRTSSWRFGKF